jgi:hypothetical protein
VLGGGGWSNDAFGATHAMLVAVGGPLALIAILPIAGEYSNAGNRTGRSRTCHAKQAGVPGRQIRHSPPGEVALPGADRVGQP